MMECQDARPRLLALLDGNLTKMETNLLNAHLATCPECQTELGNLSTTKEQVHRLFQEQADLLTVPANSLRKIKERINFGESRPMLGFWNRMDRKSSFVVAAAAISLTVIGFLFMSPTMRISASALISRLTHREMNHTQIELRFENPEHTFTPLIPRSLPSDINTTIIGGHENDPGVYSLVYLGPDWFVTIKEFKSVESKTGQNGKPVSINGQPGIIVPDLMGTIDFSKYLDDQRFLRFRIDSGEDLKEGNQGELGLILPMYKYDHGISLVFITHEINVEILTNLPEDKVVELAESLMPQKGE